jgi:hypothetical protein
LNAPKIIADVTRLFAVYGATPIRVHTLDAIALVTGALVAFGTRDRIREKIVFGFSPFAIVERAFAPVVVQVREIDDRNNGSLFIAFKALAIAVDLGCDGSAANLKLTGALNAPSSSAALILWLSTIRVHLARWTAATVSRAWIRRRR